MSDSLRSHEPQHARPPCLSPTPGVHPNPCPLSQWCHPTISSSVVPFSPCPQSFPASGSFPMSQLFASGGQSTGVYTSTSVLPMKISIALSLSSLLLSTSSLPLIPSSVFFIFISRSLTFFKIFPKLLLNFLNIWDTVLITFNTLVFKF